jgi:hypothetical protein
MTSFTVDGVGCSGGRSCRCLGELRVSWINE